MIIIMGSNDTHRFSCLRCYAVDNVLDLETMVRNGLSNGGDVSFHRDNMLCASEVADILIKVGMERADQCEDFKKEVRQLKLDLGSKTLEAETWKSRFEVDAGVREELEESKTQREELRKFLERTKEAFAASKVEVEKLRKQIVAKEEEEKQIVAKKEEEKKILLQDKEQKEKKNYNDEQIDDFLWQAGFAIARILLRRSAMLDTLKETINSRPDTSEHGPKRPRTGMDITEEEFKLLTELRSIFGGAIIDMEAVFTRFREVVDGITKDLHCIRENPSIAGS